MYGTPEVRPIVGLLCTVSPVCWFRLIESDYCEPASFVLYQMFPSPRFHCSVAAVGPVANEATTGVAPHERL